MHDAIVVGAGPAGALAALRLVERGARVLVIDKARLPRHKPCGGALTVGPVKAALGWDFEDQVEAHVAQSRWQLDFGPPVDIAWGYGAWMVNRSRFDLHILERAAVSAPGLLEVRDAIGVETVEEGADAVTVVLRGGERCRARYVIGADGAAGKVARAIGLGRATPPGLAIDVEIDVTPEAWEHEGSRMSFNFDSAAGGYGWLFPKQGYLSCGFGVWERGPRLPGLVDAYLERALPPAARRGERRTGHPIPIYEGPRRIATRRVLLVGDAASLVEPILGEGIRFALASGAIAAEHVGRALVTGPDAEGGIAFSRAIHADIGQSLDALRRFIVPILARSRARFFESFIAAGQDYTVLASVLAERFALPDPFGRLPESASSAQA